MKIKEGISAFLKKCGTAYPINLEQSHNQIG